MTKTETAWLAGLLEGEGCFRVANSPARLATGRRPCLIAFVRMTDRDVLERAHSLVQGSTPPRMTERAQENWQDIWRLNWSGAEAEQVMRAVLPYMGERRSAKIKECLATPNLGHYPMKGD